MLQVAEWRVTGVCNLRCLYCYGPEHTVRPSDDELAGVLGALVASPVSVVRFSGGEPLLVPGITSIIRELHTAGKTVVLSTNGVRFLELRSELEPYLAKVNLSLDGYDAATHSLNGRTPRSFTTALDVLAALSSTPPPFTVKVGTVLTARNIGVGDLLPRMYDLLRDHAVDRWKIYQYIPEGPIVDHTLRVSDDLFRYTEEALQRKHDLSSGRLEVAFASADSRSSAYFIVQPNGDVLIPVGDSSRTEERLVGNVLTQSWDDVANAWASLADPGNHQRNLSVRSARGARLDVLDKSCCSK